MDNQMNTEIMNEYFNNITKTQDIPEIRKKIIPVDIEYIDPIDEIIYKYSNHPSITKINKISKITKRFSFDKVDQMQIEKEILLLNAKKISGAR